MLYQWRQAEIIQPPGQAGAAPTMDGAVMAQAVDQQVIDTRLQQAGQGFAQVL
ncbi:hypothetical protein D3C73_1501740 [compost metagenome]